MGNKPQSQTFSKPLNNLSQNIFQKKTKQELESNFIIK